MPIKQFWIELNWIEKERERDREKENEREREREWERERERERERMRMREREWEREREREWEWEREKGGRHGSIFSRSETSCCHCAQTQHAERKKYTKEKESDNHRLHEQRAKISMDLQRKAIGWFSNYIHCSIHVYLRWCNIRSLLDTELIMCSENTAIFTPQLQNLLF